MRFLFLQLPPIAPDGIPARENHPLGAAHLALAGGRAGGGHGFALLERETADAGSDAAILDAIERERPDVLGATLYVWNAVRARWILAEAKRRLPGLKVIAGGPEVVAGRTDLFDGTIDLAAPGEGEVPFRHLLDRLDRPETAPGWLLPPDRPGGLPRFTGAAAPVGTLDALDDPYAAGLVDAAHDRFLYLETTRGCRFHCSFCRYDADVGGPLRFLSLPRVEATLGHARERGVREVFLLDPTLNQRKDTRDLLRALVRGNPGRALRFGGELVGELVEPDVADLLAAAGFHTVEVGLQTLNDETRRRIQRFFHRGKFLEGVRLLRERGLRVRVDLILGLPHETLASAKAGIDFVAEHGMGDDIQVFDLMVLPGTALAGQAASLGIEHLPRPPYTVIRTPTMSEEDLAEASAYSERVFGVRWTPPPRLRNFRREERADSAAGIAAHRRNYLALDGRDLPLARAVEEFRAPLQAWLRGSPFASVDVLLRARGDEDLAGLERLVLAMQAPDATLGAQLHRRTWLHLDRAARSRAGEAWLDRAGSLALLRTDRAGGRIPVKAEEGLP